MNKKLKSISKMMMSFMLLVTGTVRSTAFAPVSFAQNFGTNNLPFLKDYNNDMMDSKSLTIDTFAQNNNNNDNNLKELNSLYPQLNAEDKENSRDKNPKVQDKNNDKAKVSPDPSLENNKDNFSDPFASSTFGSATKDISSALDGLPYVDDLFSQPSTGSETSGMSLSDMIGKKIPSQYIVVLNNDQVDLRDLFSKIAKQVDIQDSEILHVYENAINGFAIRAPNDKVIEAFERSPFVDYVEQDVAVQAFAQTLPTGINRVDGDLSSTRSGSGGGTVNADIAILDTGIDLDHSDLNVYREKSFVSSGGGSTGSSSNSWWCYFFWLLFIVISFFSR
ncbi:hypothetical protein BH23THE1_BH23THE1_30120 [soil metagenome]